MITNLKDSEGKIIAYCEWRLLGPSGLEVPSGLYVWVNDCWVHEAYRQTHKIERLVDEIMRIAPTAQYCYFQRKNYNDKVRIHSRRNWERRRMAYDKNILEGK